MRNLADFHIGRGVKVYRGLGNTSSEDINFEDVGPHWSKSRQSAEDWVTGTARDSSGNPEAVIHRGKTGVLLEGRVNKKHITTPDTFTQEKEATIATGATVKVKKVHDLAVEEHPDSFNTATVVSTKRVNKKAKVLERPRETWKNKKSPN